MEKKFEILYLVRVRARYKPILVFSLCLVCSKFMFSVGIQLFGLKSTSYGKSDLKNELLWSGLPCEVVFRPKSRMPTENMKLTMLKTRQRLKTRIGLYLALTLIK